MAHLRLSIFISLILTALPHTLGRGTIQDKIQENSPSFALSPFETALETLQKQIGYTFQSGGLLRRAMTHPSFSEENNKALGVLGSSLIDTSVAFRLLVEDIDLSAKDLNQRVAETSSVESSCMVDAMRLSLHKVVRVSQKTNSSAPAIVCGAFRAMLGAITIDTGKPDDAGIIFWRIHRGNTGGFLDS